MPDGDVYRELSKKVGAEHSHIVPLIWKAVCSEDEARLVNSLPAEAEELAKRFDKTRPEMDNILHSLFLKGLVFEAFKDGRPIYRMPRHIIQFHDASTLWPEAPSELLDLWRRYTEEEYPQVPALLKAIQAPPFFRVIPIQEKIEPESHVLSYEDAGRIVESAELLAVTKCPCRMIMRKCDKPLEVCLQMNRGAEYAIKRGTGRRVDVAEAMAILRSAEEAGLVHLTENKAGIGTVICNCCRCCCVGLPYARKAETNSLLVPSRYRAVVEASSCTGCGICVDECPMDAISMDPEDLAAINKDICIGCGVCGHFCPTGAIGLTVARDRDFIPS
ncbi:MAG: 4Fe-4S binding protein [Syntrophaceae bacterium]|nr:4Fe-4S binding protein [Syntrophaceae bacterium]